MSIEQFIVTQKNDEWEIIEKSVLDRYVIKEEEHKVTTKAYEDDGYDYAEFKRPQFNLRKLCELLDNNTYHRRCCEVVAEDASGYGYNIVPRNQVQDDSQEGEEQKEFIESFLSSLYTPINTALYRYCYDKRAVGCGCIEILRESTSESNIVDLNPTPIFNMLVHRDGVRVLQRVGSKHRWFVLYGKKITPDGVKFDVDCDTGEQVEYDSLDPSQRANELIWGINYAPHAPTYGSAKVVPVIRAIFGDLGRSRYNISFFQNYGMPSYAVTVTGDFDTGPQEGDPDYDETETLQYKIKQNIENAVNNPHSAFAMLIPSDEGKVNVNFTKLNAGTANEASFRLYRADNRDEVMSAHGVPPYRIGLAINGSLGGNTSVESGNIYNVSIIQPIRKKNEDLVNEVLQNEYNRIYGSTEPLSWLFAIEEIDKRDFFKDIQSANMLFNMGAMTPRQIAENLGKPIGAIADPDNPYLDEYFIHGTPLSLMFGNAEMGESRNHLDSLHIQQQMWINELQAKLGALQLGIDAGAIPTNAPNPTFDENIGEEK
ncbi:MAG: hypothetical protein BZ138_07920 [Methanosphaera sp. rholeuAM270]|nr:MAG: hypothetical protein BZ138_07920 [Methanosphaera sp. rholeuAM270]